MKKTFGNNVVEREARHRARRQPVRELLSDRQLRRLLHARAYPFRRPRILFSRGRRASRLDGKTYIDYCWGDEYHIHYGSRIVEFEDPSDIDNRMDVSRPVLLKGPTLVMTCHARRTLGCYRTVLIRINALKEFEALPEGRSYVLDNGGS